MKCESCYQRRLNAPNTINVESAMPFFVYVRLNNSINDFASIFT